MILLSYHLLSRALGYLWWGMVQQKTASKSEIEKFITHRFWRRYRAQFEGPRGEVKARCRQREHNRTWSTCFYSPPQVECFGISELKPDWSIQTKKSGVWVSSAKILSKGLARGKSWEVGESAYHKTCLGSHFRNLTFTCDSVGCFIGLELTGGASSVSSRLLQETWSHKMDPKVFILWVVSWIHSWNLIK